MCKDSHGANHINQLDAKLYVTGTKMLKVRTVSKSLLPALLFSLVMNSLGELCWQVYFNISNNITIALVLLSSQSHSSYALRLHVY